MLEKPFDSIISSDIESLIEDSARELKTREFKRCLPGKSDSEKKEFMADVSSFANSEGGDLIYGIAEKEESGVAGSIHPIEGSDSEEEIARLENMIRDGISPRLPYQIKAIFGFNGDETNYIIFIRIPRSYAAPHMVKFQESSRFFQRCSTGKYIMDVNEIRSAFSLSETLIDKIRAFQEQRTELIRKNETPLPIESGPSTILHLIPFQAFRPGYSLDIEKISRNGKLHLIDIPAEFTNRRYNVHGILSYSPSQERTCYAYGQLYRNSIIELVDRYFFSRHNIDNKTIPLAALRHFESAIVDSIISCIKFYQGQNISPPIIASITYLGLDKHMLQKIMYASVLPDIINHANRIETPQILIDDYSADLYALMKPTFDTLWNAFGYPRSENYDENGDWKEIKKSLS